MDCSDCTASIEHAFRRLDDVLATTVAYAAQTLYVEYDSMGPLRNKLYARDIKLGARAEIERACDNSPFRLM